MKELIGIHKMIKYNEFFYESGVNEVTELLFIPFNPFMPLVYFYTL